MNERTEITACLDRENPWPALLSFSEGDEPFFGGRDEATERLYRRVAAEALTLVHSASGLGKTSLLRAGLFPRLRRAHYFPVYIRLEYVSGRTAVQQVKAAIVDQAQATNVEITPPPESDTLWEYFHRSDVEFWDEWSFPCRPVLVFDQFEELFVKGAAMADELIEQLSMLIEGATPAYTIEEDTSKEARKYTVEGDQCRIVVAIRADQMARLDTISDRFRTIFSNRFAVTRLSGEDALKSVLKAGGHLVDPAVARRIVRFVGGIRDESRDEPAANEKLPVKDLQIEPALLSVICSELNEVRKNTGAAKITAGMLSGNRDEILSNFFERSFLDTAPELREFVEDELVVSGGTTRDSISEQKALQRPGVTPEGLQKLIDRRVIRIEEIGTIRQIELTHDLLATVAARGRDFREERRRARLAEEAQQAAIAQTATARRALRRSRAFAVLFLVLLLGNIVIPWAWNKFVMRKREDRKNAQAAVRFARQALAAERGAEGLAYLAKALRLDPKNMTARVIAYDQLEHRQWPVLLASFGDELKAARAAINLNGTHIATSDGREIKIWDTKTRQAVGKLGIESDVALRFLPNGQLVVLTPTGPGFQWDPASRRALQVSGENEGLLRGNPISPTGDEVFEVEARGVIIRNRNSGRIVVRHDFGSEVRITSFIWSPDGRRVALAGTMLPPSLWDRRTNTVTRIPFELFFGFAFSTDGQWILFSDEKTVHVVDAATMKPVTPPIKLESGRMSLALLDASRKVVLIVDSDGVVRLFSVRTGELLSKIVHGDRVTSAALSSDGLRVLTASTDKSVRCWDQTGRSIGSPILHSRSVSAVGFADAGRTIVTVSDRIRIWRVTAAVPEPLFTLRTLGSRSISNGRIGFVNGFGAELIAFSLTDGKELWRRSVKNAQYLRAVARRQPLVVATDRDFIDDKSLTLLDSQTGNVKWAQTLPKNMTINYIQFVDEDRALVVHLSPGIFSGTEGHRIRFYATSDGRELRPEIVTPGSVHIVASEANAVLAIAQDKGIVKVTNWKSRTEIGTIPHAPASGAVGVTLSQDGSALITTSETDGVRFWKIGSAVTHEGSLDLPKNADRPTSTMFSPDESLIVTMTPTSIQMWDAKRRVQRSEPVETVEGEPPIFSDDGRRFVVKREEAVEVWDVATMSALSRLTMDISFAAISSDGESLFATDDGWLVRSDVPKSSGEPSEADVLAQLVEAVAGREIAELGESRPIEDPQRLASLAKQCGGRSDPACAFVRWFSATQEKTSPLSSMSLADYLKLQLEKTPRRWTALATKFPAHPALGAKPVLPDPEE